MECSRLQPGMWAFPCAALVLLAACGFKAPMQSFPDIGTDLPPDWTVHSDSSVAAYDADWWERIGGEELGVIVREAVENNNDLQAAAARIQVALAEARIAGADFKPQIDARGTGSRSRQNLTGFPAIPGIGGGGETLTFFTNNFGLSLNVSWEPDLWGRIRSQTAAALAQLQAQEAEYAGARLSLAGQTAKSWFALTEARLQVELAEATVESFRETARQAGNRVEAGVQNPSDASLAAANFSQAVALLEQRRNARQAQSRQLEILLARFPRGDIAGAGDLPSLPPPPPAGTPAEILGRRPDLASAERRFAAASAQLNASRKALYPSLNLTGSGGTTSSALDNLLKGDFLVWSLAGGLVQPIFQGGRLRARILQAEGSQAEAAEQFASQVLNALVEVETALAAEAYLRRRTDALALATTEALEAVRIAENRYGQGVDPLLVVLEAQRRALDSQSALITVRRELLENRVDLYLALGGGIP